VHSDLPILCRMNGISYEQLFAMIVQSAMERVHPKPAPKRSGAAS
jgi:hypothetical protein